MSLRLNSRQLFVAEMVLTSSQPLLLSDINAELDKMVSIKTLRSDIAAIGEHYEDAGVTVYVSCSKVQVEGTEESKNSLLASLSTSKTGSHYSTHQRLFYLLSDCLLTEAIPTLDQWSEILGASRPTIQNDVLAAREWLKKNDMVLVGKSRAGYRLFYTEFKLRMAIVKLLFEFCGAGIGDAIINKNISDSFGENINQLFDTDAISIAREFLAGVQADFDIVLEDEDYLEICSYVAVMIFRTKSGYFIPPSEEIAGVNHKSKYFSMLQKNVEELGQRLDAKMPAVEATVIFRYLFPKYRELGFKEDEFSEMDASELAYEIIAVAEKMLCIPLTKDGEFVRRLKTHIHQTVRKHIAGFPMANVDFSSFIEQYPMERSIGLQFCSLVKERAGIDIPEYEGAHITMYIAAEIERISNVTNKKKTAAIVSINALSASTLLFWQLTNSFYAELDIVGIYSYNELKNNITNDIDLIISTVNISDADIPVLVISPVPTQKDIYAIKSFLEKDEAAAAPSSIKSMLSDDLIFLDDDCVTSEELLKKIGTHLTKAGYVKAGYIEAILETDRMFGSALDMPVPIALPHAAPEYSLKTGIVIVTAKNPISFKLIGKNEIIDTKIIVFPILSLNTAVGFCFYSLISAFKDRKITEALLKCKDKKEVIKLLGSI